MTNSKNLDMGEEENRDVVVEGGTVIFCSSMVVKQCKLKEGAIQVVPKKCTFKI